MTELHEYPTWCRQQGSALHARRGPRAGFSLSQPGVKRGRASVGRRQGHKDVSRSPACPRGCHQQGGACKVPREHRRRETVTRKRQETSLKPLRPLCQGPARFLCKGQVHSHDSGLRGPDSLCQNNSARPVRTGATRCRPGAVGVAGPARWAWLGPNETFSPETGSRQEGVPGLCCASSWSGKGRHPQILRKPTLLVWSPERT